MKKSIIAIAALLAIAAACTKEEAQISNTEFNGNAPVFTASVGTKAELSGTKVNWVTGDHLAVWNGAAKADYSTTGSGATADFTTSDSFASASEYVALYPFSAGASCTSGTVTTELPAAQTATAAGFDPAAHLAVATTTSTTLSFKNAVAYLKFTVPTGMDDLTSVSFSGNSSEKVAGACTINASTGALTATGSATATLSGTFTEGTDYFIAIAPQEFAAGYTVAIERTSGNYNMVSIKDVTFARSEARNIGELWDGQPVVMMEGTALASTTEMTKVESDLSSSPKKIQFDDVFSFRGVLNAGKLTVREKYSGTIVASDITIPADGTYHVMYNKTSGRFKIYTQEMYVDFVRSDQYGASVAPWKMLRNIDPDTVDDTFPNYSLIDYDGNETGANCNLSAFPATDAYKNKGVGGNDRSMPTYYADDEEWTRGVLYDGLFIEHASGSDSDELSVIITGLNASAKYDFRIVATRFNASAAARKTRFTLVGAVTSDPRDVFQGWKPASIAAMDTYNLMSIHKTDFDGISPDAEGKVIIKVQGIDTGTRADAHFSGLRIAKVL